MKWLSVLAISVGIALFGCSDSVIVEDPAVAVVVRGNVMDASESLVSGASVVIQGLGADECPRPVYPGVLLSTDAHGVYERRHVQFGTPFVGCIKVVVTTNLPLLPDSLICDNVRYNTPSCAGTVVIDFKLTE